MIPNIITKTPRYNPPYHTEFGITNQGVDEMKAKGPAGITVIAILFFGLGILSLLWGALVFGVGGISSLIGGLFGAESISTFGNTTAWSGFVSLLSAGVLIIAGFGLLGMKKWAWFVAT